MKVKGRNAPFLDLHFETLQYGQSFWKKIVLPNET